MGRRIQGQDHGIEHSYKDQEKSKLRAAVILIGLLLMFLVPLSTLDDGRPSKFGWHMYAAAVDLPTVEIEFVDGTRSERNVGNIASGFRPEIDYFDPIAQYLCTREANAVSVTMSRQHPERKVVITCERF